MSNLTAAEQKVRKLARLPSNSICPNCGKFQKFGFSTVCVKFGTFVCNECKSSHQAISHRCKSLTMSSWDDREAEALERTGNEHARNTWLAKAPSCGTGGRPQPGDDIAVYKAFVVNAYERRMYFEEHGGQGTTGSSYSAASGAPPSSPSHARKQLHGIDSLRGQHPPSPGKAFAKPKASSAALPASSLSSPSPPTSYSTRRRDVKPTAPTAVADLLDFGSSPAPEDGGGLGAPGDPFSNQRSATADDDEFGTFQTSSAASAPEFDAFSTAVPTTTTASSISASLDFDPFGSAASTKNSVPPFDPFSSSTTAADRPSAATTTMPTSSIRNDFDVFSTNSSNPGTINNNVPESSFDFLAIPSPPTAPNSLSSSAAPSKKPIMASNPTSLISGMDVMGTMSHPTMPTRLMHPQPGAAGGMATMRMPAPAASAMSLPQMMNQMSMNPSGYNLSLPAMGGMNSSHGMSSMNGMAQMNGMTLMNGMAQVNGMAQMNGTMTSGMNANGAMAWTAMAGPGARQAGVGGLSPWAASQAGQANSTARGSASAGASDKFADLCKF